MRRRLMAAGLLGGGAAMWRQRRHLPGVLQNLRLGQGRSRTEELAPGAPQGGDMANTMQAKEATGGSTITPPASPDPLDR